MPHWTDDLPEQLQSAPYFKPTEDGSPRELDQVLADLTNASKLQGNLVDSHIKIPGADDTEALTVAQQKAMEKIPGLAMMPGEDDAEGVTTLLNKLGRGAPEKAEDYKLPEGDFEGVNLDQLRKRAHENGLSQAQFKKAATDLLTDTTAQREQQESLKEKHDGEVRAEWGDAYTERKGDVSKFLDEKDTPADLKQAFEAGILPVSTMNWLYSMASSISSEDRQVSGQGTGGGELTPGEAREMAHEVRKEMSTMRRGQPGYAEKQAKLTRLMKKATAA